MRCACRSCGVYMAHAESMTLGCVCPNCGERCRDCLGLGTPLTREQLKNLVTPPAFDAPPPGEETYED